MSEGLVRIRPAFWSPRVWPWLLLGLVAQCGIAYILVALQEMPPDYVWIGLGIGWWLFARRLWVPVVVLHGDKIEFITWTEDDDFELGVLWQRRRRDSKRVVVAASRIGSWMREGLRVRLRFPDPLSPSVRFSIAGIYERDRDRILAWLEENVGE